MKKTLSLILSVLLLFTVLPFALPAAAEDTGYAVGDIIEYGSYPQTRVTDETLIETLNRQPGEWQTCDLYGPIPSSGSSPFAEPFEGMRYRDTVCSACGDVVIRGTEIDKKAHQWNGGADTTPATCTGDGVRTYTCLNCTATKTERIPATGHSWSGWVLIQAPTCTETGLEERVCRNNSSHRETREIARTAHVDANGDNVCDVCSAQLGGGVSSNACKYCGKVHTGPTGRIIQFFHNIMYFFAHLFGRM